MCQGVDVFGVLDKHLIEQSASGFHVKFGDMLQCLFHQRRNFIFGNFIKHILVERQAEFQDNKAKKSATHQSAKVGHIGHLACVSKKKLKKFVSNPNRQKNDGRNFQIVKIKPQRIKNLDLFFPEQHRKGPHQTGDGPGSPHNRYGAVHIYQPEKPCQNKPAAYIKRGVKQPAQAHLQHTADNPQKNHVTEQMASTAVQKHVGKGRQKRFVSRTEPVSESDDLRLLVIIFGS